MSERTIEFSHEFKASEAIAMINYGSSSYRAYYMRKHDDDLKVTHYAVIEARPDRNQWEPEASSTDET